MVGFWAEIEAWDVSESGATSVYGQYCAHAGTRSQIASIMLHFLHE